MIRNNDIIQGYTVLMVANGIVLAHSETAPDPYVIWHTAENGNDVYDGKYLPNKEDAEWDFCMKAFPWFEDNAPITMIEDEVDKIQKTLKYLLQGARECIVGATANVDELVKELTLLYKVAQTAEGIRGAVRLFGNAFDSGNYDFAGIVQMAKMMHLDLKGAEKAVRA